MRYKENHALKSAADFSSQDNAFSKHCELNWSQIIMKKNAVFPKYACLHLLFIGIEMYRVSHGTKCLWLMKKARFLWLLEKSQWIQRVVSLFVTEEIKYRTTSGNEWGTYANTLQNIAMVSIGKMLNCSMTKNNNELYGSNWIEVDQSGSKWIKKD